MSGLNLPADPTARLDQVHANVQTHLTSFVESVALTLLVQDPAATAQEVAGRARASDPAVIATMFGAAMVTLAQQQTGHAAIPADLLASLDPPSPVLPFEDRVAAFLKGLTVLTLAHGLAIDGYPSEVMIRDVGAQAPRQIADLIWHDDTASYTARDADGKWPQPEVSEK